MVTTQILHLNKIDETPALVSGSKKEGKTVIHITLTWMKTLR